MKEKLEWTLGKEEQEELTTARNNKDPQKHQHQ